MSILNWQWLLVILFGLIFFLLAPVARSREAFFKATTSKGQPGVFMLTSSLVISWIFAKSITNAANLGLSFGLVGGVAYGVYYLSFVVAGLIIYRMRTQGGFASIHQFLQKRHGRAAVIIFSVLVGFRLFNEVWSNTMVIGSYFGEVGSFNYYWSILVFTALTLAYTLKGGLRSSLITDAIQMVFFGVLLIIVLGILLPKTEGGLATYISSGKWQLSQGVNLLLVAFVQVFSYPFHDSVLTDRGFISDPSVTRRSYMWAALIGFLCIVLFSFVGIYARQQGMEGQAAVEVSQSLGILSMLVMNVIMITSAASTLDSAFSSSAKLVVDDLGKPVERPVRKGRIVMILFAIAGTLPIFANPEILSATTISGTMVLGLAPVFLFWNRPTPSWSFHLAVGAGILVGILFALGWFPQALVFTSGKYSVLLAANVWGSLLCFALFGLPFLFRKSLLK